MPRRFPTVTLRSSSLRFPKNLEFIWSLARYLREATTNFSILQQFGVRKVISWPSTGKCIYSTSIFPAKLPSKNLTICQLEVSWRYLTSKTSKSESEFATISDLRNSQRLIGNEAATCWCILAHLIWKPDPCTGNFWQDRERMIISVTLRWFHQPETLTPTILLGVTRVSSILGHKLWQKLKLMKIWSLQIWVIFIQFQHVFSLITWLNSFLFSDLAVVDKVRSNIPIFTQRRNDIYDTVEVSKKWKHDVHLNIFWFGNIHIVQ